MADYRRVTAPRALCVRSGEQAAAGCIPSRRARPAARFRRDRDRIIHSTAFRRLAAQDAGLRLPRGRPLPHPADPYARGRADRARRSPARSGSTRTWPRRWRSPTISAIRRSAMPASTRSTSCLRAYRRLRPQRPDAARRHRAGAALRRLRRPQPDLGDAGGPGQAQRPADSIGTAGRSAATRRGRAGRRSLDYGAPARPGTRRASPALEAQVARHRRRHRLQRPRHRRRPARRPVRLDEPARACRSWRDLLAEVRRASRHRAVAARTRTGAAPDHAHGRGRDRRDAAPAGGARRRVGRRRAAAGAPVVAFRRRWRRPTAPSRRSCSIACTGTSG